MLSSYARKWWMVALTGLLAIVFGITAIVFPQPTLEALVILFGAFALVNGILSLTAGIYARWWAPVLTGIAGIVVGVAAFVWPNITGQVLLYMIAAFAILTGIFEIVAAFEIRRVIPGEWLMVIEGLLSLVIGALMIAYPTAGAVGLAWVIGLYAIMSGIVLTALALELRDWMKGIEKLEKSVFGGLA